MEPRRFATTRWSLIAAAAGDGGDARAALSELCATYWYPLYAFVRRDRPRLNAEDARDRTQEFFAQLLARDDLAGLDQARGRFRSWLLQSMRNFLNNEDDKARAAKRGGGVRALPFEIDDGERRYSFEPVDDVDAERLFLRKWAATAVHRALAKLRDDLAADPERERVLVAIQRCGALTDVADDGAYGEIGEALGMSAGAVRTAASRWRKHLRAEVAETLAFDDDVDKEIRELLAAL